MRSDTARMGASPDNEVLDGDSLEPTAAIASPTSLPVAIGPGLSSSNAALLNSRPDHLRELTAHFERTDSVRKHALRRSMALVAYLSRDLDGNIQLSGRLKDTASTAQKMLRTGRKVHEVIDIVGIRVVADHTDACYCLIRRIHAALPVLAGEYDDYIARPKSNGYRSLHTIALGPDGFPIEVQIRTRAMHAHAQRGTACHVRYKQLQALEVPCD